MARSLESDEYEIDFYYAMERGDQGYFLEELNEIADRRPRLRIIPISKDKLGFLTADDVAAVTPDLSGVDILIRWSPADDGIARVPIRGKGSAGGPDPLRALRLRRRIAVPHLPTYFPQLDVPAAPLLENERRPERTPI